MKILYKKNLIAIVALAMTALSYAQNSAVFTDNRSGTLGGVPFTIGFTEKANSSYVSKIDYYNVSTYSFRAARLSAGQLVFSFPYDVSNYLSITFEQPIADLKLYLIGMRAVDLRFNHPFGIAEGATRVVDLSTASVNQISVQGGGRADAIIQFTEPVTTLTFTPLTVPESGYQGITFAAGGDSLLGVDDVYTNANSLKLYPNPSSDFIQVLGLTGAEPYKIYNIVGAEVGSGTIIKNKQIEVANLVNGLYFLKLKSGNTFKFTKK